MKAGYNEWKDMRNGRLNTMKKSLFTIDGINAIFEGYTNGQHWNGWACPYFTKEVGMQIVQIFNNQTHMLEDEYMRYDENIDAFIRKDACYDEPEMFHGIDIDGMHLYPIGTMNWIWDDLADYQKEQNKMLMEYLQNEHHWLNCEQLYDVYYGILQEINGYMSDKEVKIFADGFITAYGRNKQ